MAEYSSKVYLFLFSKSLFKVEPEIDDSKSTKCILYFPFASKVIKKLEFVFKAVQVKGQLSPNRYLSHSVIETLKIATISGVYLAF